MPPEPPQTTWRAANKTFDSNELTEHFKGNNDEVGRLKPPNPFKESKHFGTHLNSLNLSGLNVRIH